jgi:diguanylate cyclase
VTIAEKIRTKIMSRQIKNRSTGEHLGAITVSIGATAYKLGDRARSIIERGDARLYEAKRSGRNCTRYDGSRISLAEAS